MGKAALILIFVLIYSSAFGQVFYRYEDKEGTIHSSNLYQPDPKIHSKILIVNKEAHKGVDDEITEAVVRGTLSGFRRNEIDYAGLLKNIALDKSGEILDVYQRSILQAYRRNEISSEELTKAMQGNPSKPISNFQAQASDKPQPEQPQLSGVPYMESPNLSDDYEDNYDNKGKKRIRRGDDEDRKRRDTSSPGVINTLTGEHYPGAAGGATNPRDGTFYNKVEGGYINTRTGQFMPSN